MMELDGDPPVILSDIEGTIVGLVVVAAAVAAGSEADVRQALVQSLSAANPDDVEEVILQSFLFSGFPRALNAAREWRRISGRAAPASRESREGQEHWKEQGQRTCELVYGASYKQLRKNVQQLHPALDDWMIEMGYGRVLSRSGLSLPIRELCVVAACAAARQERQLHSHLHGAINVGAPAEHVDLVISSIAHMLPPGWLQQVRALWAKVRRTRGC